MRVLWFKPILPFPPNQGTRRVTLQMFQNLCPDHEIHLVTRLVEPGEAERVEALKRAVPGLAVTAVPAANRKSAWHRVYHGIRTRAGALAGVPPVEGYTAQPALVRRFRDIATAFRPHVVLAEYWYSKPYLDAVPEIPSILFAHDVEYGVREYAGSRTRDPGRGGVWGRLEIKRERAALAGAHRLWFLTQGDRSRVERDLGVEPARSAVVPYGLDVDVDFAPPGAEDPGEKPGSVLLFGSFAADFNRDALDYTVDEIWPALKRLRPDAVLRVAGGGLDEVAAARCRKAGIRVEGEVADVRKTLLEAAVILIPLRFGGGLRIRLLEALALEKTVVGTPIGVLGMGPEAERHLLVGETAEELAGQTARALEEPGLRNELGRRGRAWVVERHGLAAAARVQKLRLEEAAEGGTP